MQIKEKAPLLNGKPTSNQFHFSKPRSQYQEKINFAELNQRAKAYITSLLRRLLPDGKRMCNEYVALNPTRSDKHLGSFRINIHTGRWSDFATGDKGGDIISLWAYVRGIKQYEASKEISIIIGGV